MLGDPSIKSLSGLGNNANFSRRKQQSTASDILFDDRLWVLLSFLFVLIPWAPYYIRTLPHLKFVRDDIAEMQADQKRWLSDLQKTAKKVQVLNAESSKLEEENNALLFDLREHGDNIDTANNKYRQGEEHEELLLKKIDTLQDAIQKHSADAIRKE